MRSPSSTRRRLQSRPPRHLPAPGLAEIAELVDAGHGDDSGPLAIHVAGDLELGLLPLGPGAHPFSVLAGSVAPAEWSAFGLRVAGTGHLLDEGRSERMVSTFLLSRTGEEVSLLRRGHDLRRPPGPAQGTLPDLCRRVLGLPTAAPVASTALCFALAWLDELVVRWGDPSSRAPLGGPFADLAALHPAARGDRSLRTPEDLVAVGRAHAVRWPWARLRAEPSALPVPGGPLPADIAAWMDDGFFARWVLGAYPDPASLARDVSGLLAPELRKPFLVALTGLLEPGEG